MSSKLLWSYSNFERLAADVFFYEGVVEGILTFYLELVFTHEPMKLARPQPISISVARNSNVVKNLLEKRP